MNNVWQYARDHSTVRVPKNGRKQLNTVPTKAPMLCPFILTRHRVAREYYYDGHPYPKRASDQAINSE